jgi:hypothetical protein
MASRLRLRGGGEVEALADVAYLVYPGGVGVGAVWP